MHPSPIHPSALLSASQELVQVESIAQLGVYLLLFGLGMELNLAKVRSVLGVSIIGECSRLRAGEAGLGQGPSEDRRHARCTQCQCTAQDWLACGPRNGSIARVGQTTCVAGVQAHAAVDHSCTSKWTLYQCFSDGMNVVAGCCPPPAGGSLQIILAMVAGGAISAWMCDSPVTPGVFTGALLAMSSTSVVVKCLEATRCVLRAARVKGRQGAPD